MDAHRAFDALWQAKMKREGISKTKARGAGYRWLATCLGIEPRECHIGNMDVGLARRVVAICRRYRV